MATDWSDPVVLSAIGVGVLTAAATVWAAWWAVRKDKRKGNVKAGKPAVAVGVVQKGREVILVQRVKAEQNVLWQFPAGIINPKRTEAETVVREVLEETGVKCRVVRELGRRAHPDTGTPLVYFHCVYESGDLKNGDPKENSEVRWMRAQDAPNLITSDLFPAVTELLSAIDA
jgi:8-oxo-dGTP diphosphatase